MQIKYVGTKQDFIDGQRTHAWRKYSAGTAELQQAISPILGVFFLLLAFFMYRMHDNPILILVEAVCGLYLVFARPIATLLYRRAYKRRFGGERHETSLTISDQAIDCICVGRSSGTIQWAAVKGFIQSPKCVLLYMSPAAFLNIPKRLLSDENTTELIKLLSDKGIPQRAPK